MKGIYVFNLRKNNISREDIQRFSQRLRKLSFSLKQMPDDLNEIYACTMNEYFSSLRFSFFFLYIFSFVDDIYNISKMLTCYPRIRHVFTVDPEKNAIYSAFLANDAALSHDN